MNSQGNTSRNNRSNNSSMTKMGEKSIQNKIKIEQNYSLESQILQQDNKKNSSSQAIITMKNPREFQVIVRKSIAE